MTAEVPAGLAAALELHVRTLAGHIGERNFRVPDALERAALYMERGLRERGWTPRREEFEARGMTMRNLVAESRPLAPREPFLLVGAHYDTVPSPGADDNASGSAVLLELAGLLRLRPPRVPVRLVAFAAEEHGLEGSWHHARRAKASAERLIGMLSLEMLGYYSDAPGSQTYPMIFKPFYPNVGNFIGLVSNLLSFSFRRKLARGMRDNMDLPLESASVPVILAPAIVRSDHWPFWRMGYRAAMLTDTAFLRNPNYHKPSDLPDTLDYRRMAQAAAGLAGAIRGF